MSSSTDVLPDLNTVMAAVGSQVFSYFPLGSLLAGSASPMLVHTIFHDGVFQCLGQSNNLSLSSCKHLRTINDDQLIVLVRKIIEVREASNPEYTQNVIRRRSHTCSEGPRNCSCSIRVTHLDLSRCRFLEGEGVRFCLEHMPNIEKIILSSASRFSLEAGTGGLDLSKTHYMDVSGCSRIDLNGIRRLLTSSLLRSNIRHLDLSGCSALIDDAAIHPLVLCHNLENLSLAGCARVTAHGIGLICYIHRHNLKCLNLRGCEKVDLPLLLFDHSFQIMELINNHGDEINEGNFRSVISPNLVGSISHLSTYFIELAEALSQMIEARRNNVGELARESERHMEMYKHIDELHGHCRAGLGLMFGRLEKLDIGLIGNSRVRLEGCIATIAWLNGGRLRDLDFTGLESISQSDISVLAMSSPRSAQLQALNATITGNSSTENSFTRFFYHARNISELDLSCSNHLDENGQGGGVFLLTNLRSLKLDYTKCTGSMLGKLMKRSKQLLRLSVHGCSNVKMSSIISAKEENDDLKLLELDCRDIDMDCPLSELRKQFPTLLKLNQRSTTLGAKLLRSHRTDYLWRVGERQSSKNDSKKRKRSGTAVPSINEATDSEEPTFSNCCSILRTGFGQANDTEQEMFCCMTCGIKFGRFVCLSCAKECHEGHDVFSVGFGTGYCDCCIFSPCKCLNRDGEEQREQQRQEEETVIS